MFTRLSLRERGHFSNLPAFRPVRSLEFGDSALTIMRGKRSFSVPYDQARVVIKETYGAKGYGRAHAWIKLTQVSVLEMSGRAHRFDLSGNFPNFKERQDILSLLRTRCRVQSLVESKAQVQRRMLVEALLFLGIPLLVLYGAWHWATNGT